VIEKEKEKKEKKKKGKERERERKNCDRTTGKEFSFSIFSPATTPCARRRVSWTCCS